jgi:hypothetical protein
MAGGIGLFDILDRRGQRGAYPLNENHWSNVLAWLLDPKSIAGPSRELLSELSSILGITTPTVDLPEVEREVLHLVGPRRRFIDIELKFSSGVRWLLEIKVDPAYQDREQVVDETGVLGPDDRLLLIAPHNLNPFVAKSLGEDANGSRVQCLTWKSVCQICGSIADRGSSLQPLARLLLEGINSYWKSRPVESFVVS